MAEEIKIPGQDEPQIVLLIEAIKKKLTSLNIEFDDTIESKIDNYVYGDFDIEFENVAKEPDDELFTKIKTQVIIYMHFSPAQDQLIARIDVNTELAVNEYENDNILFETSFITDGDPDNWKRYAKTFR